MKREHYKQQDQSYIDLLISLGCVTYMPLTSNSQDLISEEYAETRGTVGSYDADKGLQFTRNGGLMLSNTLFSWMGYNQSFTALIDMYVLSTSGYGKIFMWNFYGNQSNREKGMSYDYSGKKPYAHIDNGNWVNSIYNGQLNYNQQYNKFGLVYYGDTHKFSIIASGVIQNIWNTATGWNEADKYCYIGRGYSSDGFNGYLKNFMVFNRALTASELQQL